MSAIPLSEYRGPVGTTARKIDQRKSAFGAMSDEVMSAFRTGCDARMPSLSDRHSEGRLVSELLSNCDQKQEQLLFALVVAGLRSADPKVAAAAHELAQYVANDFADLYDAWLS